jgi:hypothetical protein
MDNLEEPGETNGAAPDHIDQWLAANADTLREGVRLGVRRYTLAPLSPHQMADATAALAGVR